MKISIFVLFFLQPFSENRKVTFFHNEKNDFFVNINEQKMNLNLRNGFITCISAKKSSRIRHHEVFSIFLSRKKYVQKNIFFFRQSLSKL